MDLTEFSFQRPVINDGLSLGMRWYAAGLPATITAVMLRAASTSYRSFSNSPPEPDLDSRDLMQLALPLLESAAARRNWPLWANAYIREWRRLAAAGQPFNLVDVLQPQAEGLARVLADQFLWYELEMVTRRSGAVESTSLQGYNPTTQFGTFRAALWLELPKVVKDAARFRLQSEAQPGKKHAESAIQYLETVTVPRWQLDISNLPSYDKLSATYALYYGGGWRNLPDTYRKSILDFVWTYGELGSYDTENYSRYYLFSTCGDSLGENPTMRLLARMQRAMDTDSFNWLGKIAKLVPDPAHLTVRWPGIKDIVCQELRNEGYSFYDLERVS